MPAFDTRALVPLFDRAHPHHRGAQKAFRLADEVLVHPCVLSEFTRVIRRIAKDHGQNGNAEARQCLMALLNQRRVRVVHVQHDKVLATYLAKPTMSYADAVVASLDKNVVTFDQDVAKRAKPRPRP